MTFCNNRKSVYYKFWWPRKVLHKNNYKVCTKWTIQYMNMKIITKYLQNEHAIHEHENNYKVFTE